MPPRALAQAQLSQTRRPRQAPPHIPLSPHSLLALRVPHRRRLPRRSARVRPPKTRRRPQAQRPAPVGSGPLRPPAPPPKPLVRRPRRTAPRKVPSRHASAHCPLRLRPRRPAAQWLPHPPQHSRAKSHRPPSADPRPKGPLCLSRQLPASPSPGSPSFVRCRFGPLFLRRPLRSRRSGLRPGSRSPLRQLYRKEGPLVREARLPCRGEPPCASSL
jgi:hypothetical protein